MAIERCSLYPPARLPLSRYIKSFWYITLPPQLRDISMTQDMDPGRLNIITYDMVTGTKFILRAPKTSIRDMWLARANELIRLAKQNNTGFMRGRSASEPGEHLSRTPTFMRRSMLSKRESTKRKSRPSSSSGRRSGSPEQQVHNYCVVLRKQ